MPNKRAKVVVDFKNHVFTLGKINDPLNLYFVYLETGATISAGS